MTNVQELPIVEGLKRFTKDSDERYRLEQAAVFLEITQDQIARRLAKIERQREKLVVLFADLEYWKAEGVPRGSNR